jgi:hypothetical protein
MWSTRFLLIIPGAINQCPKEILGGEVLPLQMFKQRYLSPVSFKPNVLSLRVCLTIFLCRTQTSRWPSMRTMEWKPRQTLVFLVSR